MKKLRLDLDAIRVDTFTTTRAEGERGTVKGHVCCCCCCPCCCTGGNSCGGTCDTCLTGCGTCQTCATACGTCESCGTCPGQWSCDFSCYGSCDRTCDYCPSNYQIICEEYPVY
ncbi:MAG TPA: hypothetical protein VF092_11585 [Longimicrobium sp.]